MYESSPTLENYEELLIEMLNTFNYAEYLIAGIDDRNVRVGRQCAEFTEPEQVVKFLKSIKVGQNRVNNNAAE